jgi:hypothetical protein
MRSEKTGRNSENLIEQVIKNSGYEFISKETMNAHLNNKTFNDEQIKVYTKNWPLGICLYPYVVKREEFILYNPKKYPKGCILTVKWQQSPGTGYEKAPYLLLNVLHHYPVPSIIVWDGNFEINGVKGAYEYLKRYVNGTGLSKPSNLLGVYTNNEFVQFANRGGL